jgi:hypothetical protein
MRPELRLQRQGALMKINITGAIQVSKNESGLPFSTEKIFFLEKHLLRNK